MRGPVNKKQLAIETAYGYLNIHLSLLHQAIKDNDKRNIMFQKEQLHKCRSALLKLGYFERKVKK